jgi:hypothetical protein
MPDPQIETIAILALRPWKRNARTHSKRQIWQIADSIKTFGFRNAVLIDAENTILAGDGRVEAAKLLGIKAVPCVRLEHMTPDQKRANGLAKSLNQRVLGSSPSAPTKRIKYSANVRGTALGNKATQRHRNRARAPSWRCAIERVTDRNEMRTRAQVRRGAGRKPLRDGRSSCLASGFANRSAMHYNQGGLKLWSPLL